MPSVGISRSNWAHHFVSHSQWPRWSTVIGIEQMSMQFHAWYYVNRSLFVLVVAHSNREPHSEGEYVACFWTYDLPRGSIHETYIACRSIFMYHYAGVQFHLDVCFEAKLKLLVNFNSYLYPATGFVNSHNPMKGRLWRYLSTGQV